MKALWLAAMLAGAPLSASAKPAARADTDTDTDVERYALLEATSPDAATFEGGSQSVYIGGSALTLVLLIVLIVIVL